MSELSAQSGNPIQSSLDGKIHWDQGLGQLESNTTLVAIKDTASGGAVGDIQKAIDTLSAKGGGVVLIRNGTYYETADIIVPDNVTLQGETSGAAIIDFQNLAYQVKVAGTIVYSTGTVAVNNKSTTVTGTGTAWDSSVIGQYILLAGRWFGISAVTDGTHLTIDSQFDGTSRSGDSTYIGTPAMNVLLSNFTVQNSAHADGAVYFQYVLGCNHTNLQIYDSIIGLSFFGANSTTAQGFNVVGCETGVYVENCAVWTMYNFNIYGSVGVNLYCVSFINASVSNFTISSAGGNNITLDTCTSMGIYDSENTSSSGKGIEMSACTDIEVFAQAIRSHSSDGVKLTANNARVSLHNMSFLNNGGWGVNIPAASNSKNTLSSCFFSGNSSGTVNNLGTSTINANSQT